VEVNEMPELLVPPVLHEWRRESSSDDAGTVTLTVHRGLFWPLIIAASLLEAVAAACLAVAVFSDPVPRRLVEYRGSETEVFGRVTSLDWSADRGFLITAIVCFVLGIALYVLAARSR
jgi:hypothetical protein